MATPRERPQFPPPAAPIVIHGAAAAATAAAAAAIAPAAASPSAAAAAAACGRCCPRRRLHGGRRLLLCRCRVYGVSSGPCGADSAACAISGREAVALSKGDQEGGQAALGRDGVGSAAAGGRSPCGGQAP